MSRTLRRFHEFGSLRLLREYARMGLLPMCFKQEMAVIFRKKKPIEAYGCILGQAGSFLESKSEPVLEDIEGRYSRESGGKQSRYVWVCWLQGMGRAPKLVQVCYRSIQ